MTPLIQSRQCAYMINAMIKELGLGSLAEYFSGEDPDLWVVVDSSEVRLVKSKRLVAVFDLFNNHAQITIPYAESLIRHSHWADFDPAEYGILPLKPMDYKGDRPPQLIASNIPIPNPETLLQGPRQYIPPSTFKKKPTIIRQFR